MLILVCLSSECRKTEPKKPKSDEPTEKVGLGVFMQRIGDLGTILSGTNEQSSA